MIISHTLGSVKEYNAAVQGPRAAACDLTLSPSRTAATACYAVGTPSAAPLYEYHGERGAKRQWICCAFVLGVSSEIT